MKISTFIPKQSLPVGSTIIFDREIQDVGKRGVNFDEKKLFIFADNYCGSCIYLTFPLIEWVKEFREIDFYYIEQSDKVPTIYSELMDEDNFYAFVDSDKYFHNMFKEPSTPSVFFVDKNNMVVWKRTGFLISDYREYKKRIEEFTEGKTDFEDYQRNITINQIFPGISYNNNCKVVTFPDNFKGKPALLFFIFSSCKSCKAIIESIPPSISESSEITKIIVFAGITEDTINENLNFARHFSLRDVELQVKQAEFYKYIDYQDLQKETSNFKSTYLIEDDFFSISEMIGLAGGPFVCVLNPEWKVLSINGIGFEDVKVLKTFFEGCIKLFEERR